MPAPFIAAGIGAAASIGGAALSSGAQRRAADSAADTAANTSAQNNALLTRVRNENTAILNPYVTRGNEAGSAINSLLGISGTLPAANPGGGLSGGVGAGGDWALGAIDAMAPNIRSSAVWQRANALQDPEQRLQYLLSVSPPNSDQYPLYQAYANSNPRPTAQPPVTANVGQATGPTTGPMPERPQDMVNGGSSPSQNAFQNYLNSTGYQFQIDQGNKAINQGYAARGSLQSGAALKALQTYGQNTATGFFKDYLGLLSNQQGVGLSGANALAGVGTNYANSVGANNNNASSAAANAALAAGNANANMWGSIGGAIGGVANAFGSSYRRF